VFHNRTLADAKLRLQNKPTYHPQTKHGTNYANFNKITKTVTELTNDVALFMHQQAEVFEYLVDRYNVLLYNNTSMSFITTLQCT